MVGQRRGAGSANPPAVWGGFYIYLVDILGLGVVEYNI